MSDIARKATPPPDLAVLLEETGDHTDSQKLTIAKTLMVHVARHLEDQDHSVDAKFDGIREELMAVRKELAITRQEVGIVAKTITPVIDFTRALTKRYPQGIEPGWAAEDDERAYLMRAEKAREKKADIQHRQQMDAIALSQAMSRRTWKVFQAVLALLGVIAVSVFGIALTAVLQNPHNAQGANVVKVSGAILVVIIMATAITLYRVTPLDLTPVRVTKRSTDPPDDEDDAP